MKILPFVTQSHPALPRTYRWGNDTLKLTFNITLQMEVIKGYPNNS